ncbi:MAG: acyl-CoA dehydrogenase family protein, partial [Elusimicrobia bacterium]|nr:acyl-CoA dehydrogenase family protein [Elusimicrobiota bacterium]
MPAAAEIKRKPLDPADYYRVEELCLSDDERLVRDTAAQFARKELAPKMAAWDRGEFGPFPSHEEGVRRVARQLAEQLGIFGATLKDLGRYLGEPDFSPLSHTAYGLALREIEAVDSGLRSMVSVQSSLCMYPIYSYGSEEQKRRWLPVLHRAEKLACFGLTEPQGGSDPARMLTTARKTSAGWVLNGSKAWITNGFGDVAVVWAKAPEGVRGFLVEKGTPGFTYRNEEKWALRCGVASSLEFAN